jgi:hypothetical protein
VGVACEFDSSRDLYLVGVRSTKRLYLIDRKKSKVLWDIPSPTDDQNMLTLKKVPYSKNLFLLKDSKFISVIGVNEK